VATGNGQTSALLRRVLNRLGWQAKEAANAAEARRQIFTGHGRTVILATDLIDESGWLTCAKIKRLARRVDVYLLGPDLPRNRRLARFVGATAFLTDPVELGDWLQPVACSTLN
jgi:DNA-binding response OmpR family regulator